MKSALGDNFHYSGRNKKFTDSTNMDYFFKVFYFSFICMYINYDFSLLQIRKRVICCNLSKSQSWSAAILTHYTVFDTQSSLTVVTPFITIHGDKLKFLLLNSK